MTDATLTQAAPPPAAPAVMNKDVLHVSLAVLSAVASDPKAQTAVLGALGFAANPVVGLALTYGLPALLDVIGDLGQTFTDEDVAKALLARGHKVVAYDPMKLFG